MIPTFDGADLFCGGGGSTTGLELACEELGYRLNLLAINHWDLAIATHKQNHPQARQLLSEMDAVSPRDQVPSGHLDILVASPECIFHSRALGGRPVNDQSRASAWHVLRWAEALRIDNILIENVPEFREWGPLDSKGRPLKSRKGEIFRAFLQALTSLGYKVEHRVLNAADYGDATTRQRLFILARRGRRKIVWPDPTHAAPGKSLFGEQPWRAAKEIIDWQLKGESIFTRKKPLSPNTLKRIEAGLAKFSGIPFILNISHAGGGPHVDSVNSPMRTITTQQEHALVEPFVLNIRGGNDGYTRGAPVSEPLQTITGHPAMALVEPFLVEYHDNPKHDRVASLQKPLPTIATYNQYGLVEPFLTKYYATATSAQSVKDPLDTVTTKDRFGLVVPELNGARLDIRFRMLQPHELAAAMSFPKDYTFAGTREHKIRQIGNAVPVQTAKALCLALLGD